jgi:hypothetical protein
MVKGLGTRQGSLRETQLCERRRNTRPRFGNWERYVRIPQEYPKTFVKCKSRDLIRHLASGRVARFILPPSSVSEHFSSAMGFCMNEGSALRFT